MFHFKYKILCSVEIRHPYYRSGESADFLFHPFPSTQKLMDDYQLVWKEEAGKLNIYQKYGINDNPYLPINIATSLFFTIQLRSNLANISNNFGQHPFWFSNIKSDGTFRPQLTEDPALSPKDELANVQFLPQSFNFPFVPGTLSEIKLTKLVPVNINPPNFRQTVLQFGINDQDQSFQKIHIVHGGRYTIETLTLGGVANPGQEVLLHDDINRISKSWGIFHLQLPDNLPQKNYNVTLEAKSTPWFYLLIENSGVSITNPSLVYHQDDNTSRYPTSRTFQKLNNSLPQSIATKVIALQAQAQVNNVHVYVSNAPISLFEDTPPRIELIDNGKVLNKKLAIPNRANLETIITHNL